MSWAPLILVAAGCSLRTSAQPGFCASDHHCQGGFYCVPDIFQCQQCLDCEDLKRDPPSTPTPCIRSVAECGSCIKGLVNLRGDVAAECVTPPAAALPIWAWALVSLGLLLFVLVVVAVLYMLRNTNTFKILASTRTSVRSPVVASAPDAPPPYRAHYNHQNEHRNLNNHDSHYNVHYDTETETENVSRDVDLLPDLVGPSAPCVDGSPPPSPRSRKPQPPPHGPRELSAHQETRYFNQPYYVRPPTYSDAGVSSPASLAPEPPSLHDEDTMESTWTPAAHDDNGNVAGGSELTELLAAARLNDQRLNHHIQHHHPCTQDSNNNRSSGAAPGDADPSGSAQSGPAPRTVPHAPVSYIINVVQNMQSRT